ncbi:LOW QUALITY PROTEIN: gastrin-releasing peptide [Desmodus rotundus]|uniref:LOW QUALITY PROTEIN: gastrin-releasing peptide n=1 Tax=Desmodus rotundus TaxID=9430 RepID=UPI00238128C2|nr:LOW QUALITY PROTEIN: gastrin-releasing peptide [Desmodus rotundus]
MRGCELPLVLLVLVLCQAPRGPAAPVPAAGETVLAKMYPRGSHWAVGHLMGKKSTAESAYVNEGGSLKHQLREYILWEEAARNLLSLMEGKGTRSHQSPQGAPLSILQFTRDSEDNSNLRDLLKLGIPGPPSLATPREPREVLEPAGDLWIPSPPQSRTRELQILSTMPREDVPSCCAQTAQDTLLERRGYPVKG